MGAELPAMLRSPSRCHCRNKEHQRSTASQPSARDTPLRYTSLPRPVRAQRRCRNSERSSTAKAGTSSNLGLKRRSESSPICRTELANPRWAQLWCSHTHQGTSSKERGPKDSFFVPLLPGSSPASRSNAGANISREMKSL